MIWAGLTDHLLCKTELFLDTRFSFFLFLVSPVSPDHTVYQCNTSKIENKSFKSFQPGLNLTI